MKKVILILAASFLFAACGGSAEQAPAADSTKVDSVAVDSAKVDSVAVEATPVAGGGSSEVLGNPTRQPNK